MNKFDQAENQEVEKEKYSVVYLTDEKFLTIDSLDNEDVLDSKVEVTWTVLVDSVDKIIVNFSNSDSVYPDDTYQLKWFTSWDSTFLYRAFWEYETLDNWVNKYIIEAYSWDIVSKLELTINVFSEDVEVNNEEIISSDSETEEDESVVMSEIDIDSLPKSEVFWNPVSLGSWKYSYDWIRWLEFYSVWNIDLDESTDSVTSYLSSNIDWWFFWNTLRSISDENGVSFYVIRLDWDNYFYEKHYYTNNWIYWVMTLESWTWVNLEELEEKNTSLKDVNDDFVITAISDALFKKIID